METGSITVVQEQTEVRRRGAISVLLVSALGMACSSERLPACAETVKNLPAAEEPSGLGFSLNDVLESRGELSIPIDWEEAPAWVGLTAHGSTDLHASLKYVGAPIEAVSTTRGDLDTNDVTTCAPHLRTELALSIETADGAIVETTTVHWRAFEPALILIDGSLEASRLVAPGVRVSWNERIDSGRRVGGMSTSREERHGSGGSFVIQLLARWSMPDPGSASPGTGP